MVNSTTEEQVHSPTSTTAHKLVKKPPGKPRPGTYPNRSCSFCGTKWQHYRDICLALGQTCSCSHKTDHFASVCQQVAKDNRASKLASHKPTPPSPRREHMRLVEQEEHFYTLPKEGIQYENCFTLSSGQPLTLASLQRPHPLTKVISSCFFWKNQTQTAERKFLFK